jgi:phage gpG-like protein
VAREVSIEIDTSDARNMIAGMIKQMTRYSEPFREANFFLREEFGKNFDSSGSMVGGWAPLAPRTQAWRASQGYPPTGPILVNDGSLRAAVLNLKSKPDAKRATFYVDHPVAGFHQYGSTQSNLPQRRIVFDPPGFSQLMARRISAHIMPDGMTRELKRLFRP